MFLTYVWVVLTVGYHGHLWKPLNVSFILSANLKLTILFFQMIGTKRKTKDSSEFLLLKDKEIKFDIPNLQNRLANGENVLANIPHIEDSKGNSGDSGTLLATNLRIIWYSLVHKKFNLAVGYGRIITLNTRTVFSKVRGTAQALYILAAGENSRFEFLFTDVSGVTKSNSFFSCIYDIHQIYQRTFLYRELKLRSAILRSGQLILLPGEQIYSSIAGVWNLSNDTGNLGSFIITNIRVVWFANVNENFNISLPYIQISNIKIRDSKYGDALVVQTSEISGGGYVLGFRIDPPERLIELYKELSSLFIVYSAKPNFGVQYIYEGNGNMSTAPKNESEFKIDEFQEINEVQEKEINSKLTAYLAEGYTTNVTSRPPFYCKELGFAMEEMRSGYKLSDLWEVAPTSNPIVEQTEEIN
ncbi:Bardet-Biedl syndrome 5 protein homolog [Episyrphus balteatus]|uniref:Bardet-Biedl syndrome 5 protein homolog n=1 Tax=Episyrphus balteatus TaxID=286459 RepID=UPI0024869E39|nr:Bardet-Biedl syndrome 5 protein homolog [Episyrphus balteatus]